VDQAQSSLVAANAALSAASLVAPFSGTVAKVDFAKGDTADTSSSILILGHGSATVTVTLTENDVRRVKVGQSVKVRPDGATEDLQGQVVSIGLLPSSSTGTASYPVVIGIDKASSAVISGAQASVSIKLGEVPDALTLPSSAVSKTTTTATVNRLVNGKVEVTQVKLGTVGTELTQITEGLKAGDQVVLADLTAAVPSAQTQTTTTGRGGFGGGQGGFGGGQGGPPGGFRGPAPSGN
jgi:multidrug efflux pump subunit AcrA (membrane-fusion protein)